MIEQQQEEVCTEEETFELFKLFESNPHVVSLIMYPDQDEEFVAVTFQHYTEIITVVFNVTTQVGLVKVYAPDENNLLSNGVEVGCITVEKLLHLLDKLPHIFNYMEDEGLSETVH